MAKTRWTTEDNSKDAIAYGWRRRKSIVCRELERGGKKRKRNLILEAETENPQPEKSRAATTSAAQTVPEDTTLSKTRELLALMTLRCSLSTSWFIVAMALSTAASWLAGTWNSDM